MKKFASLLLAALLLLPLIACGGAKEPEAPAAVETEAPQAGAEEPTPEPTEEPTPEPPQEVVYQIGETAKGELFNVRLDAVVFLRAIENGRATTTYDQSGGSSDKVYDAVPTEGYTVAGIVMTFSYNGKQRSELDLERNLVLDYDDGYTFSPIPWNEHMPTTQDQYSGYYRFNKDDDLRITVSDPLSFQETTTVFYIFMNDVVRTDTEKPLLLKIDLPTADGTEQIVFNAREDMTEEERKEELYEDAVDYVSRGKFAYAISCLEELGDYRDSAALYAEASLKYSMLRDKRDEVAEHVSEFRKMDGSQISGLFPDTWKLSQGGNAWDFYADGTIDDHWGNARTWKVDGDKLILSASKTVDRFTVYEVYPGWYFLQDESQTDWHGIQLMFKEQ